MSWSRSAAPARLPRSRSPTRTSGIRCAASSTPSPRPLHVGHRLDAGGGVPDLQGRRRCLPPDIPPERQRARDVDGRDLGESIRLGAVAAWPLVDAVAPRVVAVAVFVA